MSINTINCSFYHLYLLFYYQLQTTVDFIALRLGRTIMHQHTKIMLKYFQMILVILCFFHIFQMTIGHHVEFLKTSNFICWRGRENRDTSACQVWSIQSRNIAIFRFSKWLPPLSWIFEIAKLYWLLGSRGSRRISVPNFVKIGQSVANILSPNATSDHGSK